MAILSLPLVRKATSIPVTLGSYCLSCSSLVLGSLVRREKLRILIAGHSVVFWAAHQAGLTPIGSQLGLSAWATVEWQGHCGLQWPELLSLLFEGRSGPPPDILVLHLGGNNLGLVKGKALVLQALENIEFIRGKWPGVFIVWSAMIPRRLWRGSWYPCALDRARRKANRELRKSLEGSFGLYVPHPGFHVDFTHLYSDDGINLSEAGNKLFLEDLQQGLHSAISLCAEVKAKVEA